MATSHPVTGKAQRLHRPSAFLFLTYILQGIEHLSPLAAGLGFLPLTVINGLASTQLASRLLARIPVRAIVVPGC